MILGISFFEIHAEIPSSSQKESNANAHLRTQLQNYFKLPAVCLVNEKILLYKLMKIC